MSKRRLPHGRITETEGGATPDAKASKPIPRKRQKTTVSASPVKRVKRSSSTSADDELVTVDDAWIDWPAPRAAIERAREFLVDISKAQRRVLLLPDKDADGLTAGYVCQKTLELLGLPASNIFVHVLSKGTNVHSESEIEGIERLVENHDIDRVIILDQGSRPGPVVRNLKDGLGAVLLIDHHQSDESIVSHADDGFVNKASLIALLKSYGDKVDGFKDRVGDNFARGHNEATGGIIRRVSVLKLRRGSFSHGASCLSIQEEFEKLLLAMGIDENKARGTTKRAATKTGKGKIIDPKQSNGIKDFFKVAPPVAATQPGQ
ncbi:hypothetical protein QFC19_003558 [Naganishia cerealis]|uniref:Uncharacterized protein n=1 Tax=Naganishia cerealis TaxID=610337 RepID=A0ACC2W2H8_9TREE|nr:hypothetical protein QFC19_003558 [Naganishia cerealis]